jgi:predicted protein tyrosine phosphatase
MEDYTKKPKENLLFLCTMNFVRSPTAQYLFEKSGRYEAKSAGFSPNARVRVTEQAIQWADIIFVMDDERDYHRKLLLEGFPEAKDKDVRVLRIPDDFSIPRDGRLIKLLKRRLKKEGINVRY